MLTKTTEDRPTLKLSNRVALVTGGSRGIGRAICLDLARAGAAVAVNYVSHPEAAEGVVTTIEKEGGRAIAVRASIGAPAEVEAMIEEINARFGHLDILVMNGGIWRGAPLHKLAPETWWEVINTNLGGLYYVTRAALPGMMERRWGRIVCVSSVVGLVGWPGDCAYGTVKAGMIGFARSLAKEVAKYDITVNVIVPGYVQTDMTAAVSEQGREVMKNLSLFKEAVPPEEVAAGVTFLVSGPKNVTGHILTVDGGLSL